MNAKIYEVSSVHMMDLNNAPRRVIGKGGSNFCSPHVSYSMCLPCLSSPLVSDLFQQVPGTRDFGVILRADSLTSLSCNPLETECASTCFDGREYTINVEATDVAGLKSIATCVVKVDLPAGFQAEDCTGKGSPKHYKLASSTQPSEEDFCRKTEYFRLLALGGIGLQPVPGYGCNGINDNCDPDQQIDECDEDHFKPVFNSETAIAATKGKWFTNGPQLLEFMKAIVDVKDDCGPATYTSAELAQDCSRSLVTLKARDACNNEETEVVSVQFDPSPPTVNIALGITQVPGKYLLPEIRINHTRRGTDPAHTY